MNLPQHEPPVNWLTPHPYPIRCFDVEAGVLVRRHLRHLLKSEESCGNGLTWFETKGWLSSTFHVEAEQQHALNIYNRIKQWREALEE